MRAKGMFVAGVRTHFVGSRSAASLMIARRRGVIVNTVAWAFGDYLDSLSYDVAKAAIVQMAFGMAEDVRPRGVSAIAVAPGFIPTERVLEAHAEQPFDVGHTESPVYLGRAITTLTTDAAVLTKSGQILTAGELARDYGFTDLDGRQPESFRIPTESPRE